MNDHTERPDLLDEVREWGAVAESARARTVRTSLGENTPGPPRAGHVGVRHGRRQPSEPSLSWLHAGNPPVEPPPGPAFGVDSDTTTPGTTRIRVTGELDAATWPTLGQCLRGHLVSAGPDTRIELDLSAVTFISVGALRDLVTLTNSTDRRTRVVLGCCSPAVLRVIEIVGPP